MFVQLPEVMLYFRIEPRVPSNGPASALRIQHRVSTTESYDSRFT
jgi:hypothetical protein